MKTRKFDRYLKEISLVDYYQDIIGELEPHKGTTRKHPKFAHYLKEGGAFKLDELGNKIKLASLVFKSDDKGFQSVYIHSEKLNLKSGYYNVVQLVQAINGGREKFNLGHVRKNLDEFMLSDKFTHIDDALVHIPYSSSKGRKEKEEALELLKEVKTVDIKTAKDKLYLESRGFDADEIINSEEFGGLIKLVPNVHGYLNTNFIFKNEKGDITGYLQKFNTSNKGEEVVTEYGTVIEHDTNKYFAGNKTDGAFISNEIKGKKVENVVLVEAPEDAIAHWKLNQGKNKPGGYNLYIASGGNFDYKFEEIYFEKLLQTKAKNTIIAYDNDQSGRDMALKILARTKQTIPSIMIDGAVHVAEKPVLLDITNGEHSHDRDYFSFVYDTNKIKEEVLRNKVGKEMYKAEANSVYSSVKGKIEKLNDGVELDSEKFHLSVNSSAGVYSIIVDYPKGRDKFCEVSDLVEAANVKIELPLENDWNLDWKIQRVKELEKGKEALLVKNHNINKNNTTTHER